ncbi:MAG: sodium:calcium antiporter [Dehalococcoidia bacterium]|nr:sodium:calcium antiporter [Dehalococcoidia bacterium]
MWIQLAIAAGAILWAATYMAGAADVIAVRTGLGRTFIGGVMLATATSLPELGIGVTSIAVLSEPDLAAGDAFGSNLFNLLIIGLLDFFWRDGPLLNRVSFSAVLIGALGILVIGVAATSIFIHQEATFASGFALSPLSVVLLLAFAAAMYILFRAEQNGEDTEEEEEPTRSLGRAFGIYGVSASVVVAAAIWLAFVGDSLAEELGLERSFIGTQFLALSTSLPELAASIAAIRLGAPELAISNVLGSNLFNMGFILFIDDAVYVDGPIWEVVASVHVFTALAAVLMTAVVIIALMTQERGRPGRFFTFEAVMLVALYLGASALVFQLA